MNTHIFKNGFKLIHQSVGHSVPITSIFVYIKFGSIHEIESFEKGIAHFIEHICFTPFYISNADRKGRHL